MAPVQTAPTLPLDQIKTVVLANLPLVLGTIVLLALLQVWLFASSKKKPQKPFLDPNNFQAVPLAAKKLITHNTVHLRFELPHKDQRLGLPIGQHITFLAKDDDGKDIYRSYTPVSDDDMLGAVEFVIKVYPQGKMSQVIHKMQVGDTMLMKGPKGRLRYMPNMKSHIGMLAGGTGVTPMYQVLNAILKNPADNTRVSLVFANIAVEDILLHKELEDLAAQHPQRFKVHYVLNSPPPGWTGSSGFVTPDIIRAHLSKPGPDCLILRCGPPPMNEAMKKHLDALGYDEATQFQF